MSESPRRFSGGQLTTILVAGMATVVLFPVAVSAAPSAFSLADKTGTYRAAVNRYGQVSVAGPVSLAPNQSVRTVDTNTTVVLKTLKFCDGTVPGNAFVNVAAYGNARVFLRNNDVSSPTTYTVSTDFLYGSSNNSVQVDSGTLDPLNSVTRNLDTPGTELRITCTPVSSSGVLLVVMGRP